MTFCSTGSDYVTVTFLNFGFNLAAGDTLFAYDGPNTSSPMIGAYCGTMIPEPISSQTGSCITFRFKSDLTAVSSGWRAVVECSSTPLVNGEFKMMSGIRYTCGGVFYDSGGPNGNYKNNESNTLTFVSSENRRLQFNFQTFYTEVGDNLYIYDGPTTNHPLIGVYSGSAGSPGIVQSTGTSMTFRFVSDGSYNYPGWAALISCTTPALPVYNMSNDTVFTCEGVFYDSGGPDANYMHNDNKVMTFCSENEEFIHFTFQPNNFKVHLSDTLYVYDGASVSAPIIGKYTGDRLPEVISSLTGSSLTFKFVSDLTNHDAGWQALIGCTDTTPVQVDYRMQNGVRYTCGGIFYDSGGLNANYSANENYTETFVSSTGSRLQFNFQAFSTESTDKLYIYDGPTVNHPLIGVYSGSAGSPGIVQSSGTSLTFKFVSDQNTQYAGWAAFITCTTPALPVYNISNGTVTTCEGVFYDSGGPDANYMHNDNKVMTFCSENEEFIHFTFQPNNFKVHLSDTLYVYDGASVSAPIIGKYTGDRLPEVISSLTGSSLTFKFVSDLTNHDAGWQALIGCTDTTPVQVDYRMQNGVRYTCGGIFYDSGGLNANYSANENYTETFVSSTGSRLQFNF
ncbi:MAG: CUB domain-containing protein [Bacteroidales bacterium]|jgi:nitrous oxide reductase accessory protein NosL